MLAVRPAVAAGRFYPAGAVECEAEIRELLPKTPQRAALGAIVPHAGWMYSGSAAALSWSAISAARPDAVVIFGAAHSIDNNVASLSSARAWQTPLGPVAIDIESVEKLSSGPPFAVADRPHQREHSIEVQLPLVHFLMPAVRIVPIVVPPSNQAVQVGWACADTLAASSRRIAYVGSTDLTHYGAAFGFEPHGHGARGVQWAKEVNDRRLIDLIQRGEAEAVVEEAERNCNACGAGAIAATMGAMRRLGTTSYVELLHTTSADVRPDEREATTAVGYEAGIFVAA